MKFLLCFGIVLAFVTERALAQHYLLGKFPIQSDGRNFGGLLDPNSVTTRLSSLETSVTPLTSGLAALQNQVAAFPSQVANLQSQVSPLQSLPNQVATLVTKLTADEALIATAQANITALQTQLATAQANTSALQTQLATAQANITALQTQLATAQTNITTLQTQLTAANTAANTANATANTANATATAAAAPKCSSTAPTTAKIVLDKCYQVFTNTLLFSAAKEVCIAGGGKLAEPLAADAPALWTALKTAFSTETTTIANTGVWLGFSQGANVASAQVATTTFPALSNPGVAIAVASFKSPPAAAATGTTYINVAVLDTPSPISTTPFISTDSDPALGTPNKKPFICQY